MNIFSNNLIIILSSNISIFFIITLFIFYSRKSKFLFYKKSDLKKIEKDLSELNISNIFKERIIEIYHFLNSEKDSESIASTLKLRLKPLIGFSDIKLFILQCFY